MADVSPIGLASARSALAKALQNVCKIGGSLRAIRLSNGYPVGPQQVIGQSLRTGDGLFDGHRIRMTACSTLYHCLLMYRIHKHKLQGLSFSREFPRPAQIPGGTSHRGAGPTTI